MKRNSKSLFALPFLVAFMVTAAISCQKNMDRSSSDLSNPAPGTGKPAQLLKDFEQVNLVANNTEYNAAHVDPTLLNGWGIAFSTTGVPWVNAEASGISEVYDKEGAIVRPPVAIPSPTATSGGDPTGIVFNSTSDFKLPNGNPARFIFDGIDGVLSGWNGGNNAVRMVNNNGSAVYTGLAIGASGGQNYLYAANFMKAKIDVFDKTWAPIQGMSFTDAQLPAGYAPFNIQNLGGKLYVMYAKVGSDGEEEVGAGNGYVDIYNTDGSLAQRLASRGQLNAPWGVAIAPAGFFSDDNTGKHSVSSAVLVGNFGDGHINAYTTGGEYLGQLRAHGNPVVIEGLWAIMFPPATATSVDPNRLYFAAGPDDEQDGLFGYIHK